MKMTLTMAMAAYGKTDKQYFPCFNGFDDANRPNSLFFADFVVAELDGEKGVKETFKRAFAEWSKDVKMFTELTIVMNHLLWNHYNDGEEKMAHLYDKLWRKCDDHARTFKGEDARYYFEVTD